MGLYSPIQIETSILLATCYPYTILSEKVEKTDYRNGQSIYITNRYNQRNRYIIVGHTVNSSFSPDYFYRHLFVVPYEEFYPIKDDKEYIGFYFGGNWDRMEEKVVNKKKIMVKFHKDTKDDMILNSYLQSEGRTPY